MRFFAVFGNWGEKNAIFAKKQPQTLTYKKETYVEHHHWCAVRDLWNIHAGVQTNQAREIHEDAGYAAGVRREGRICGARYHLLRYPPRVGNSLPRAVSGLRSGCVHAYGSGVFVQLIDCLYL